MTRLYILMERIQHTPAISPESNTAAAPAAAEVTGNTIILVGGGCLRLAEQLEVYNISTAILASLG